MKTKWMNRKGRNGATLLLTIGILSLLSTLAVIFYSVSKIRERTQLSRRNLQIVDQQLDRALLSAVRQIEVSLTAPNYSKEPEKQRLVPVGRWISEDLYKTNDVDVNKVLPEWKGRILLSPSVKTASGTNETVNLLTREVLALFPSSLTNGLAETDKKASPTFRSGWITLESQTNQIYSQYLETRLQHRPVRVAYAVVNASDLVDLEYYLTGPDHEKRARRTFSAEDVTNLVAELPDGIAWNKDASAFTTFSYDPDPNSVPIRADTLQPDASFGTYRYGDLPTLDLNTPGVSQIPSGIRARLSKFNINVISNQIAELGPTWFNNGLFRQQWLTPVTSIFQSLLKTDAERSEAFAWSIANWIDPDRVPTISTFTHSDGEQLLPSRVSFADEAIPLINKVAVFNLFDEQGNANPDAPKKPDFYDLQEDGTLTNHYAVAVELWYPYAPQDPFVDPYHGKIDPACYVGIYTNESDAVTTTNRPWTSGLLQDWLRWNLDETQETLYQTLFRLWGNSYMASVGNLIWAHPLWQALNQESGLWFTEEMRDHPYWPEGGTNGVFTLSSNFVWQVMHPPLVEMVETNLLTDPPTVTTNVLADMVVTNTLLHHVSEDGSNTQAMVWQLIPKDSSSTVSSLWLQEDGSLVTRMWTGFVTEDGVTNLFGENMVYQGFTVAATNGAVVITTQEVVSNQVESVSHEVFEILIDDGTALSASDLALVDVVSDRPVPLPMPDPSLLTLYDALLLSLPTNTVSLYTQLMLKPDDENLDWDTLYNQLSSIPNLLNKLFPSLTEPSMGNLTEEDRFPLDDLGVSDRGEVTDSGESEPDSTFKGRYFTVYPKKVVNFMEVTLPQTSPDGEVGLNEVPVTNYLPIAARPNYKVWVRPLVTLSPDQNRPEDVATESETEEIIVDEALLTALKTGENQHPSVLGWEATTNLFVRDPRDNAFVDKTWSDVASGRDDRWIPTEKGVLWTEINEQTNGTVVTELPFQHGDVSFSSIADLGYVYAAPTPKEREERPTAYDTIDFSRVEQAALLDFLTISTNRVPYRGLIQANTESLETLDLLFAQGAYWSTNELVESSYQALRRRLSEAYTNALDLTDSHTGWRSFSEMMPALCGIATNQHGEADSIWEGVSDLHPLHDYMEDVLRHLPEWVSFRQSVYHIILAVQALSPLSTPEVPVPIAEKRIWVTISRDTFTGQWKVISWRQLR